MATAILPAQDCLNQDKWDWDGHGGIVNAPRRKSNRSKKKVAGGTRESNGKKLKPPNVSNAINCCLQKNEMFLNRSSSCVNGEDLAPKSVSSARMQFPQNVTSSSLPRCPSTPPTFNTHQLSLESVSYGSKPVWNFSINQVSLEKPLCRKGHVGGVARVSNGCPLRYPRLLDNVEDRKNLQMEQVSNLKRNETIKSAGETDPGLKRREKLWNYLKNAVDVPNASANPTNGNGNVNEDILKNHILHRDSLITSTEHLGPDPSYLPRKGSGILRTVSSAVGVSEAAGKYTSGSCSEGVGNHKVGSKCNNDLKASSLRSFPLEKQSVPAFSYSPPPSCLPLPKFTLRQNVKPATHVGVNTVATTELRRLLGLDRV